MMELYRAKPRDGIVWITGASAGIGKALALQLAAEGFDIAATARSEDKLAALVDEAKALPGHIHSFVGDVTDELGMAAMVDAIEATHGPISLAVFNAGNYYPTAGEALNIENFRKTYEINLFGVMNGLVPVVEKMKAYGQGQVVLVASVSGYSGLPAASAYGASKAAINNMAESLKFDFDKMNIRIQVVNPGFIDTPLTEKNDFEMPALMPVDKAAKAMADGIRNGGFEITFPRRFTYVLKLLRMLPHPVYFWLMSRATDWKNRPFEFGDTMPAKTQRTG